MTRKLAAMLGFLPGLLLGTFIGVIYFVDIPTKIAPKSDGFLEPAVVEVLPDVVTGDNFCFRPDITEREKMLTGLTLREMRWQLHDGKSGFWRIAIGDHPTTRERIVLVADRMFPEWRVIEPLSLGIPSTKEEEPKDAGVIRPAVYLAPPPPFGAK